MGCDHRAYTGLASRSGLVPSSRTFVARQRWPAEDALGLALLPASVRRTVTSGDSDVALIVVLAYPPHLELRRRRSAAP